jgi:hypothetical protein
MRSPLDQYCWCRPIGGETWHAARSPIQHPLLLCGYPYIGDVIDLRAFRAPPGGRVCGRCLAVIAGAGELPQHPRQ